MARRNRHVYSSGVPVAASKPNHFDLLNRNKVEYVAAHDSIEIVKVIYFVRRMSGPLSSSLSFMEMFFCFFVWGRECFVCQKLKYCFPSKASFLVDIYAFLIPVQGSSTLQAVSDPSVCAMTFIRWTTSLLQTLVYLPQSHGIWAPWSRVSYPCSAGLHAVS